MKMLIAILAFSFSASAFANTVNMNNPDETRDLLNVLITNASTAKVNADGDLKDMNLSEVLASVLTLTPVEGVKIVTETRSECKISGGPRVGAANYDCTLTVQDNYYKKTSKGLVKDGDSAVIFSFKISKPVVQNPQLKLSSPVTVQVAG